MIIALRMRYKSFYCKDFCKVAVVASFPERIILYIFFHKFFSYVFVLCKRLIRHMKPDVGLEPAIARLRVWCSTDGINRAVQKASLNIRHLSHLKTASFPWILLVHLVEFKLNSISKWWNLMCWRLVVYLCGTYHFWNSEQIARISTFIIKPYLASHKLFIVFRHFVALYCAARGNELIILNTL